MYANHSAGTEIATGYSMSPLDNATPVILDENVGDLYVSRTVLRTDPSMSCSPLHSGPPAPTTCSPAHLCPPSPRLHVASDPAPFSHTSIYPSPPISNYISPPVSSSSNSRSHAKSPVHPQQTPPRHPYHTCDHPSSSSSLYSCDYTVCHVSGGST